MCDMMYGYVCSCLETASFHMPLVSKQLSKSWTVVQTGLLLSCHTEVSTSALHLATLLFICIMLSSANTHVATQGHVCVLLLTRNSQVKANYYNTHAWFDVSMHETLSMPVPGFCVCVSSRLQVNISTYCIYIYIYFFLCICTLMS